MIGDIFSSDRLHRIFIGFVKSLGLSLYGLQYFFLRFIVNRL